MIGPVTPLPPPDGAFRRVRRRAFVRRMRVPAVALSLAALAGVSFGAIQPRPTASLEPAGTPFDTGTPTYTVEPVPTTAAPTASPTPSVAPSTQPPKSPTPTPSPTPTFSTHEQACWPGGPGVSGPDVTGTVVDRDGHPVEGVHVATDTCDGIQYEKTDAHGRFSIVCVDSFVLVTPFTYNEHFPASPWDVGFAFVNKELFRGRVPCGSDHRVVLPRAGTIRAHLVDQDGNPAVPSGTRSAHMFYEQEDATGLQHCVWDDTSTCVFTGLAPGRYELYDVPQPTSRTWVTVPEGQTVDVNVVLKPLPSLSPSATPTLSPTVQATP